MKKLSFGLLIAVFIMALLISPSMANSSTVLNLEDLTDTGGDYHTMTEHNPYHDVTFQEVVNQAYIGNLDHYNNADYANPHSGDTYLFNAWGLDNLYIEFSSPLIFEGAWVGHPHYRFLHEYNRAKEFWFEGYLGATKVGESAKITLGTTMQWCQADFGGSVDTVVFRRNPHSNDLDPISSFYTIDDITFGQLSAPILIDDLTSDIMDLDLPKGTKNNLIAKISVADKIIEDENVNNDIAAISALESFINQVEAQRGKKISIEDADELVAKAQAIINLLQSEE